MSSKNIGCYKQKRPYYQVNSVGTTQLHYLTFFRRQWLLAIVIIIIPTSKFKTPVNIVIYGYGDPTRESGPLLFKQANNLYLPMTL